jgi:hypothetical protein
MLGTPPDAVLASASAVKRMSVRRTCRSFVVLRAGAVAIFGVAASCSTPSVVEVTAAACSNGIDDDGDGAIDCDDADCAPTNACERSRETCSDGIDDDRDGLVDCEQASCREAGYCEPLENGCDVAAQTGCPRGMGCFPRESNTPVCAVGGEGVEADRCGDTAEGASVGCALGHFCLAGPAPRHCYRLCAGDGDCPRSSLCLISGGRSWGICSFACLPQIPCPEPGDVCIAVQRAGFSIARGGWVHACLPGGNYVEGAANVGDACADVVGAETPKAEVCRDGLLCVPDPMPVCRTVCIAAASGEDSSSCGSGRCVAVDPFDARKARESEDWRVGVCLQ